eukprot:TRINITY_DN91813_c0_g1_i1.p1 TRINITY_DN91813_c0_g1~~TRINITY_DN91813_c0_g1_i1.p1  ORF type:complete len:118 (+),score=0.39 TRINITY_DN91813_c0_g1_i1:965-1318(+)
MTIPFFSLTVDDDLSSQSLTSVPHRRYTRAPLAEACGGKEELLQPVGPRSLINPDRLKSNQTRLPKVAPKCTNRSIVRKIRFLKIYATLLLATSSNMLAAGHCRWIQARKHRNAQAC